FGPGPWNQFSTYDSACQIAQEIAEKIQQRNQYERRGEKTSKLTVTIRALLQNLKEKITLLKDLLLRAVSTHQMKSNLILREEGIWATQIFPQLWEDLVSTSLHVILFYSEYAGKARPSKGINLFGCDLYRAGS
uniref:Uncharacterized protein n=1 Tax=Castor canadensis TaxID=51338 RepID=A0A8C0XYQ9_CASCN